MNGLDFFLGLFLAFFSYRGFRKGLVREGCGLAGLVLGITAAVRFHSQLAELLSGFFSTSTFFLEVLSFLLLFVACVLLLNLVGFILNRLVRIFLLSFLDHMGGVIFGLFKGAAIAGFVILVAQEYMPSRMLKDQTGHSLLAKPLTRVASFVIRTIQKEPGSASKD